MRLRKSGRLYSLMQFVRDGLQLRLFTSITASKEADKDDTVVEVASDDYKPIRLSADDWTKEKDAVCIKSKKKKFTFSGPLEKKVAGYYLTAIDDDDVLYAEAFDHPDAPYEIKRKEDSVSVTAVLDN